MLALSDAEFIEEIRVETPGEGAVFLTRIAQRNFTRLGAYAAQHPLLRFAYSVKTNPSAALLRLAHSTGCYAEVISPAEADHAAACGFDPTRIVYNGPVPATNLTQEPAYIFADSVEAFARNTERFRASPAGVRVCPAGIVSRFGVASDDLNRIAAIARQRSLRDIGVSFHVRPQDYDGRTWRKIVESALDIAVSLQHAIQGRVVVFDVGGGKRPDEFDAAIADGDFEWLQRSCTSALPYCATIIAEPGQAVVSPVEAYVATVLEVRRCGERTDVVVDAGYPDIPQTHSFAHRVFFIAPNGEAARVPVCADGSRILGRTCLEYDIVAENLQMPKSVIVGDRFVIAETGAYDASMRFAFAAGC